MPGPLEVTGHANFTLDNRSGWSSRDLAYFFAAGLRAYGVKKHVHIIVTRSPIYSRGCAQIGGKAMVIAISSPSKFELRRLARLFQHEVAHLKGQRHEDMPDNVLWSEGPLPAWAKLPIRWEGSRRKRPLSRKRRPSRH